MSSSSPACRSFFGSSRHYLLLFGFLKALLVLTAPAHVDALYTLIPPHSTSSAIRPSVVNKKNNAKTSSTGLFVSNTAPSPKRSVVAQRAVLVAGLIGTSNLFYQNFLSASFLGKVNHFYKTYPFLSAVATCSVKGCLADTIAQTRDKGKKFSLSRNFCYVLYGGLFLGLGCETMYNHVYPRMFGVGDGVSTLLTKVAFDSFLGGPLMWLPPLYFVKAILYGNSLRFGLNQYVDDVRNGGLLTSYWKVWIPVQLANFGIVPSHLRVAVMAGVSFFWMIILSCLSSNKKE